MTSRLMSKLTRGVVVLTLSLAGLLMPISGTGNYMGPKMAEAQRGPALKGQKPIIARPRPNFKGPALKPRPTRPSFKPKPVRPRPSLGGGYTRPSPLKPRPSAPTTRPSYNYETGQGVRPIEIRPQRPFPNRPGLRPLRPNKPYPQYPDFVDTPDTINDVDRPKPPGWRPPSQRPPHYRPPHYLWGDWHWWSGVGWYHRYPSAGTSYIIVHHLPRGCRTRVRRGGVLYYRCNDVYYRSAILRGERVYIISGAQPIVSTTNQALRLTRPFMRGPRVKELQRSLKRRGYNIGNTDGIFGRGTERALMRFQRDVGLTPDGVAGPSTLRLLR